MYDESSGVFEIFSYDFDDPSTTGQPGGSLGNGIETIIGPGDSGGAALRKNANGWELVGINTFTEGYGGRFGDTGGGVLVEPYGDWIYQVTGIPEVSGVLLWLISLVPLIGRRKSRGRRFPPINLKTRTRGNLDDRVFGNAPM